MSYISSQNLSVALGMRPTTLQRWPRHQQPKAVSSRTHRYSDVNEWLAEPGRAHGFVKPPTIEQILAGEVTFVLRGAATRLLTQGIDSKAPHMYVWHRIETGQLKALHLRPQLWVVTQRSIEGILRQRDHEILGYTTAEVSKIFGVTRGSLDRLAASGKLIYVTDPEHANRKRATQASVVALAASLLAQSGSAISAEDWIDDCLNADEPLLTVPQTAQRLGIAEKAARRLLTSGEIFFIPSPEESKWFVSPHSVAFYQSQAQPLTALEKAKIFGTSERSIVRWEQKEILKCPIHEHEKSATMYRWCMAAYLEGRVSPGVSVIRWLYFTLDAKGGMRLWQQGTAVQRSKMTAKKLLEAGQAGRIPMVVGPGGTHSYAAVRVMQEAKRLR